MKESKLSLKENQHHPIWRSSIKLPASIHTIV